MSDRVYNLLRDARLQSLRPRGGSSVTAFHHSDVLASHGSSAAGADSGSSSGSAGGGVSALDFQLFDSGSLSSLPLSIHSQQADGHTALTLAAAENSLRLVRSLIGNRANVNAATRNGRTALHYACEHENTRLVKLLLEHDAIPLCYDEPTRLTPLHIAAMKGNTEICELLLEYGADIAARDKDGWPPLFWALQNGHNHLVTTILEYGDDATVDRVLAMKDKNGWRPELLERAALLEHLAGVQSDAAAASHPATQRKEQSTRRTAHTSSLTRP